MPLSLVVTRMLRHGVAAGGTLHSWWRRRGRRQQQQHRRAAGTLHTQPQRSPDGTAPAHPHGSPARKLLGGAYTPHHKLAAKAAARHQPFPAGSARCKALGRQTRLAWRCMLPLPRARKAQ